VDHFLGVLLIPFTVSIRNNITIIFFHGAALISHLRIGWCYLLVIYFGSKPRGTAFSTLLKRSVDKFVLCIFLVVSCKVAPPNCLMYHVIRFCNNNTVNENENVFIHVHIK
jgi:hypothetical protein